MVRTVSVFSKKKKMEKVMEDLCRQVDAAGSNPQLIVYTSENDIFWYVSQEFKNRYPTAQCIGSTSFRQFNNQGYGNSGASALVIFSGIECSCGALFDANRHPMNYLGHIVKAMKSISSYENTCCLEFCTAFSLGEEIVLDTFETAFEGTNITVIGSTAGSSADDKTTYVALNGEMYANTCVFCLIHNTEGRIAYYRENIFKPTDISFITTDVDCERRVVFEYDNKPAALALCESLNVTKKELVEYLKTHLIGRIEGNEVLITEAVNILEDDSIEYFSRIYNRSKVVLLEPDDEEKVWKKTDYCVKKIVEKPSFSIMINCSGRVKYFESKKLENRYFSVLKENYGTFLSVSGYGEQFKCTHLNQTMVIAVFE